MEFNNLTYLPSVESRWEGNNLAQDAEWTSGGRKWRTQCDTAETGRGGCRSWVWTKRTVVTTEYQVNGDGVYGYGHYTAEGWWFNNIVMFSSTAVPPCPRSRNRSPPGFLAPLPWHPCGE